MLLGLADTIEIAPGVEMPRLGFGTYRSAPGAETEQAVRWAIETGYRCIDTAALYGNEASVAAAIRSSGLDRESVFVATKVWNDDQGYETTLRAFDESLRRLSFDYVDLYLVHWPIPSLMRETWRAMEEIARSGRARAVGVCNHFADHLDRLAEFAEIPPAVDQIEFHVRLQQPDLQRYLADHSVTLEAWAPVMRGGLGRIPEIESIANAHDCTPEQIGIRWILQKGHVAIPKSVHRDRIQKNADVFGFELSPAEMTAIDSLDTGTRIGPHPDKYASR